jgi:hypothetical protein
MSDLSLFDEFDVETPTFNGEALFEGFTFNTVDEDDIYQPIDSYHSINDQLNNELRPRCESLTIFKPRISEGNKFRGHISVELRCDHNGIYERKYQRKAVNDGGRPNQHTKKTGCPGRIQLKRGVGRDGSPTAWWVETLEWVPQSQARNRPDSPTSSGTNRRTM